MKKLVLPLLTSSLIFLAISPSFADNITTQQIGNFKYTNGNINGQPYHTTTQQIGGFEYKSRSLDGKLIHTTTQKIGSFDYINGDLGGFDE